jgi:hypothetical protein
MALIDQLNPQKTIVLPNSEEQVVVTLVPQHQLFTLAKEVDKYLAKFGLEQDLMAKKQAQEAALLIASLRKVGSVDLASGNRGEPVFGSIEQFLMRFSEGQQDFLLVHYLMLQKEAIPAVSTLSDQDVQTLFEEIDAGKDLSPRLSSFDFASLLSFTLSLASQQVQSREACQTTNSPTSCFLSAKRRSAAALMARRAEADAE